MSDVYSEAETVYLDEESLTQDNAKMANFGYDEKAFADGVAEGVARYAYSNNQNIPLATTSALSTSSSVLDKGFRSATSTITKQLVNHFFGRISYNLNKLHAHMTAIYESFLEMLAQDNNMYSPNALYKKEDVTNIIELDSKGGASTLIRKTYQCLTEKVQGELPPNSTANWKDLTATKYFVVKYHNVPRAVPKDITSYYEDGTLWDRIAGTNGYSEFEDVFVGDYIKMSRRISTRWYLGQGTAYVTIAGINTLWGNGFEDNAVDYNHLVMVPGQGFQSKNFGEDVAMNTSGETIEGGYYNSEMHQTTLGAVTTTGSTASTATINEQLYAEFGSHLKTVREVLSNSVNTAGYNRIGTASGCSNNWSWYNCQAVLMSEIEVYGSIVWSSSGYDTGTANHQLPLFAHVRRASNNSPDYCWLRDIASKTDFCCVGWVPYGMAYRRPHTTKTHLDLRPRFVIA